MEDADGGISPIPPEGFWRRPSRLPSLLAYSHQQAADVENAIKGIGRISRLRTPFCLAYAKTPACFRDGKLAPQAEACMHLGYSRTKPGYALEVIEGPRKGRVITTSQVKFREDVFPMLEQVRVPTCT